MSFEVWLTFIFAATIILIVPGPTIIYVVGQSLSHGKKASIPLIIGVISGDTLCIILSLMGLNAILLMFSTGFIIIKYVGAAYLIYLGIKMVISGSKQPNSENYISSYNSKAIFKEVFLVNALNPKGIIFYSAFMPQFVNLQENVIIQFSILTITFLTLALLTVISFSLLASKTNDLFKSSKFTNIFNITGGLSLICAGLYSATIEKK